MSAVEPPSSSAAAAPAPREFYHFDVTFYFSLISFLYDEGVPNRRGVDLSLVVTLYSVYVLVCFLQNYKHMCAETRSGNDVVILSC